MEAARAQAAAGNLRGATEAYFDAFEAGFRHPLILTNLGASLYAEGRVREAVIAYREALSRDPRFLPARSNLLLALNCLDDITPSGLAREHQLFGTRFENPPPLSRRRLPGKFRLGFVSSSFFRHSMTQFFAPVFRTLDHAAFETFCYQGNTQVDDVTEELISSAAHWRVIAACGDAEATERIRRDDIDVLFDLDGHTSNNRLAIFAAKPARVQVSWLGYPNTTGLHSVDFRITDAITDPEPCADGHYTEKLIRLKPPFLVYSAPEDSPKLSPPPAETNRYVTFGIFNQVHKYSDGFITAASRVLECVPESRLFLKSTALTDSFVADAISARFAACGLDRKRIQFVGPVRNHRAHLEMHGRIDIMLDPFPYNGTTTTCEALWMGVPVVTLEGLTHQARVGSSILQSAGLRSAGLPNLIAKTPDQYVSIAQTLASDLFRAAPSREQMREALRNSPLMDLPAFVSRFQNAILSTKAPGQIGTLSPLNKSKSVGTKS